MYDLEAHVEAVRLEHDVLMQRAKWWLELQRLRQRPAAGRGTSRRATPTRSVGPSPAAGPGHLDPPAG